MIRLSEKWFEAQIYRGNVRFYSLSRWRFFPPPPPPFPLSLSYSVRHDGSRFRSYTKIRTRSILRSKLIEFFRDSISRIIRRQVFNELLCTSRFRNLSINHHPRKRSLYTARDKGVDRQNRWDQSTTIHSPPSFSQSIAKRNLVVVTPGKELNGARRRVSRKEIVHFRHGTIDIIDEAWTSAASLESRETADLLWASGQRAATEPGPIFHPREHGLIIYERANARGTIDFTGEAN